MAFLAYPTIDGLKVSSQVPVREPREGRQAYTAKMTRLGKRVRDESLQVEPLKEQSPSVEVLAPW